MNTMWSAASAVVTGSRHLRGARNGQDAAAVLVDGELAVAVVCDGCGSAPASEVGARLGAEVFARAVAAHAGLPSWEAVFATARAELLATIAQLAERLGDRERAIRDHFLFTVVASAARADEVAIWSTGDGCYALDGAVRELGPFADNEPPYIAYALLDLPAPSELVVARASSVIIATDGAIELDVARFATRRYVEHPDALRRELTLLARASEQIDWDERRVVRTPAALQDDCAVAVLLRGGAL